VSIESGYILPDPGKSWLAGRDTQLGLWNSSLSSGNAQIPCLGAWCHILPQGQWYLAEMSSVVWQFPCSSWDSHMTPILANQAVDLGCLNGLETWLCVYSLSNRTFWGRCQSCLSRRVGWAMEVTKTYGREPAWNVQSACLVGLKDLSTIKVSLWIVNVSLGLVSIKMWPGHTLNLSLPFCNFSCDTFVVFGFSQCLFLQTVPYLQYLLVSVTSGKVPKIIKNKRSQVLPLRITAEVLA
jgi:hypothetical protein